MINDLDKIDAIRYDNKETITLYIFDVDIWKTENEKKQHYFYTQKKIEAYVSPLWLRE